MNYQKVMETISTIYKEIENKEDKLCIFINGEWGIGKTRTIKNWFKANSDHFNIKYLSVFGKQSIREIENELIMKMLSSISDDENEDNLVGRFLTKRNNKAKTQIGFNILREVLSKKIGIKLEASEFVKNISIENLVDIEDGVKKVIVCLDDIERLSNKIDIKDMLGLIQRTAENFNVIIIANSLKIHKESLEIFEEYKEKVVDYEFEINELDNSLLKEILTQTLGNIDTDKVDRIIKTFNIPLEIEVENSKEHKIIELKNIRIYKRYIKFISRVLKQINNILQTSEFSLDDDFIDGCKTIIGSYYFDKHLDSKLKSDKQNTLSFRQFNINKILYKIFMYESYNIEVLRDLLKTDNEISKDIKELYHLYRMDRESADLLLKKIEIKIEEKDTEYFINQENIITLYDALNEIEYCPGNFRDKLFEEAKKLYQPVLNENPFWFDSDTWSEMNYAGEGHCSINTLKFINNLNSYNKQVYLKYRKQEFLKAFDTGNVDVLIQVISRIKTHIDKDAFEKVFEFAIKKIDAEDKDKNEYWKLIYKLMDKTEYEVAEKYLKGKISLENDYLAKRRLTHLAEKLQEEEYYRRIEAAQEQFEAES